MTKNRSKKYALLASILAGSAALSCYFWPERIVAGGYIYNQISHSFDYLKYEVESIDWFQDNGGTVTLLNMRDGATIMTHDGYSSLYFEESNRSMDSERLNGAVVASLMPEEDRENAVILGFGTGITIGEVAKLFDSVVTFEVREAMLELSDKKMRSMNNNVVDAENSEIVMQDAIVGVANLKEKQSAIYVNVPTPGMRGTEKLYAAETLSLIKSKVRDDGLVFLWMTSAQGPEVLQVLINTIESELGACRYFIMTEDYFQAVCAPQMQKDDFFSINPRDVNSHDSYGNDFGLIARVSEIVRHTDTAPHLSGKTHTLDNPWFDTRALFTNVLDRPFEIHATHKLVNKSEYCAFRKNNEEKFSTSMPSRFCGENTNTGERQ